MVTSPLEVHLGVGAQRPLEVVGEGALLVQVLDVATIGLKAASSTLVDIVFSRQLGEAPLLGDNDLLASRELELCTTQRLDDDGLVVVFATDGEDDLTNVDTGSSTVGLSIGATHTGLETIRTGTGQHLVDADDVEGMKTDTHVERVLAGHLGDVLVGADTAGLEGLGRDLLLLVTEEVDAERELVDRGLFATEVVDANLGVWDTTAEARLWVSLVLLVSVAASRTATHFVG